MFWGKTMVWQENEDIRDIPRAWYFSPREHNDLANGFWAYRLTFGFIDGSLLFFPLDSWADCLGRQFYSWKVILHPSFAWWCPQDLFALGCFRNRHSDCSWRKVRVVRGNRGGYLVTLKKRNTWIWHCKKMLEQYITLFRPPSVQIYTCTIT